MTQLAKPNAAQLEWQNREIGMFIHWVQNTYLLPGETDAHAVPLSRIDPRELDTEQWVDVAESMGAKYIVFVAKHATGFCTWATDTTDFSIRNTPWRGGKGDIVRDLSDSCAKRGIALGLYLSPRDDNEGARVGGGCITAEEKDRYAKIYRAQLTELLTRYGDICEVWFDGSVEFDLGDVLKRHVPNAMIFQSDQATIRWVGNEDGYASYPAWNAVSSADAKTGVATNRHGTPDGDVWLPLECDAMSRGSWFWAPDNAGTLKSVDELMEMYMRSVGHGAVLLLNQTPDTLGRIPEADAIRAAEFGDEIRRRFGQSLASTSGNAQMLELTLPNKAVVDHVILMEDLKEGEKVRAYTVEAWRNGEWTPLVGGTAIGHKKIDHFPGVETAKLRVRIPRSVGSSAIREFSAYATGVSLRGHGPTARPDVQIGEWGRETFYGAPSTTPVTLEFDISGACLDAREYDIDFVQTGGDDKLEVASLAIVHDGQAVTKWVSRGATPGSFIVAVTEISDSMSVRAIVTGPAGPDTQGKVVVTPRFA